MKTVSKLFSKLFRTILMIVTWPIDRFFLGDMGLLYLTPEEMVARAAKRGWLDELAKSIGSQTMGAMNYDNPVDYGNSVGLAYDLDAMAGIVATPESLFLGSQSRDWRD